MNCPKCKNPIEVNANKCEWCGANFAVIETVEDDKQARGNLLVSIVNKMMFGRSDWTLEELQYQKNYPQEIEKALFEMTKDSQKSKTNASEIVVVPSYLNILQRKAARKTREKEGVICRRILNAPLAVALAHYFDKEVADLRTAIVILEKNSIDIAIIELGGGVFEVKCYNGKEKLDDNIELITELCRKSLQDAENVVVDELILVGDFTHNSIAKRNVENVFAKTGLNIGNIDKLQEKGAIVQMGILSGKVKNVLLLDAISLPIGIEMEDGIMTQIIRANTGIPTKRTETISTEVDNQSSIEIHILQGECIKAEENVTVGRFSLDGISPAPKGVPQIEVTFDIDANEIIRVLVKDKTTGKEINVRI